MQHNLDATYWNNRYLENNFGWDIGHVSTPLKEYFDQLKDKNLKILIPGAGNSYEAEYLVNNGFTNVYVCDIAPEPLKNLKARCQKMKNENLLLQDFFSIKKTFDLIVEQTFFCALNPSLRKAYFEKMSELLNPKGKLIGLMFNDKLNSDQPPFGGNKEEYLTYIPNELKIITFETCYNSVKPRAGRELFINLERI